ncbi:NAD(P)-binding protein [Roridomyces roridus]|uniref:NAD(P)-binding protein n=1 Tax=Roridomyces roridus TaxID=1738132 RepID=A0AAD7B7J4_9AGAR|nr:NAD(P)-binding protein [Roridomyces roridus]
MGGVLGPMSKPAFEPVRDIPDLSGKGGMQPSSESSISHTNFQIIIVTGGNTGIGYETVKQLLLKNAKVYLAARSPGKAATAIQSLEAETKATAIFLQLDLGDLASVRQAAESFLKLEGRLDILFNNAGVMNCPTDMLTKQGHDLQFGTNVLGHFFFTELLLPALTRSYEHSNGKVPARIITTSSIGHHAAPGCGFDVASLRDGPERDAWIKKEGSILAPVYLYGRSKIGNIYMANYWAKAHSDVLVSCSVHSGAIRLICPQTHDGSIAAPPSHRVLTPIVRTFLSFVLRDSDELLNRRGALPQLWAATAATPAQITGQYVLPWGVIGKANKRTADTKVEREMIEYMREQLQEY